MGRRACFVTFCGSTTNWCFQTSILAWPCHFEVPKYKILCWHQLQCWCHQLCRLLALSFTAADQCCPSCVSWRFSFKGMGSRGDQENKTEQVSKQKQDKLQFRRPKIHRNKKQVGPTRQMMKDGFCGHTSSKAKHFSASRAKQQANDFVDNKFIPLFGPRRTQI